MRVPMLVGRLLASRAVDSGRTGTECSGCAALEKVPNLRRCLFYCLLLDMVRLHMQSNRVISCVFSADKALANLADACTLALLVYL